MLRSLRTALGFPSCSRKGWGYLGLICAIGKRQKFVRYCIQHQRMYRLEQKVAEHVFLGHLAKHSKSTVNSDVWHGTYSLHNYFMYSHALGTKDSAYSYYREYCALMQCVCVCVCSVQTGLIHT